MAGGRRGAALPGAGAVLALLLLMPGPPPQASGFTPTRLAEAEQQAEEISADRAAEIAREITGGRVLGVDRRGNGRPWYRVKVLVDGERVRHVAIDARSGRVRD